MPLKVQLPNLTLCVIARDEEAMLGGCLASVAGIADELLVVDTGSTDRTVEIARAAGAKVVHFAWCDDFAAARNAALPHVTGDWILVLDADERLIPGAGPPIRQFIGRGDVDLGLLPLYGASRVDATLEEVLQGSARQGSVVLLPRLLRRTPDLAWQGVVHEHVVGWLRERTHRIQPLQAPIVHYGAAPSLRKQRLKTERNLRLLHRRLELEPDEPAVLLHLAGEHEKLGDAAASKEYTQRSWETLCRVFATRKPAPSVVEPATMMARVHLLAGNPKPALDVLHQAFTWGAEHPNLRFLEGRAFELRGEQATSLVDRSSFFESALERYQQCAALKNNVFTEEMLNGVTTWLSELRFARTLLHLDRPNDALAVYQRVWTESSRPEGLYGQVEAHIRLGDPQRGLSLLQPVLSQNKREAWVFAASAHESVGDFDKMSKCLAHARGEDAWSFPEAQWLFGELNAAFSLYRGAPLPGKTTSAVLGALLFRKPVEGPVPFVRWRHSLVLANLLRSQRRMDYRALLEPNADQVAPGLVEATQAYFEGLGIPVARL